jgi:hypothetical protein
MPYGVVFGKSFLYGRFMNRPVVYEIYTNTNFNTVGSRPHTPPDSFVMPQKSQQKKAPLAWGDLWPALGGAFVVGR